MPTPFRPTAADLARIGGDVAPIAAIQRKLVANHPQLKVPDRVAHQYQVAGGKVFLRIGQQLPRTLSASACSSRARNIPASGASRPGSAARIWRPIRTSSA